MRDAFRERFLEVARDPRTVFLTGDLGFMALEPVRDAMGERFINCGVAEQNMISVAAGLASEGLSAWVYSIAPFCVARPFEQIRNDVALHGLPVKLVGNGGGFGYGVMGPTHHAIEDYGLLLTLPGFTVHAPVFDADITDALAAMAAAHGPTYLRLGRDERPPGFEPSPYAAWRELVSGQGPIVITAGAIAGASIAALADHPRRPALWAVSVIGAGSKGTPEPLLAQIANGAPVVVVEEHVAQGGLGQRLAAEWLASGVQPRSFRHLSAAGFPYSRYGSQRFHRVASGLDPKAVREIVDAIAG